MSQAGDLSSKKTCSPVVLSFYTQKSYRVAFFVKIRLSFCGEVAMMAETCFFAFLTHEYEKSFH